MLIRGKVDGQEKLVYWNWCGMGVGEEKLAPGESFYFYIDPEFYRKEYGANISLGLGIAPERKVPAQKDFIKSFLWSEWIELPAIEQKTKVRPHGMARTPSSEKQIREDAK